jgi:sugar/nucleoside kinase (ribokinase family)
VEAAGDCSTLLLDKTGTITYGNRLAAEFAVLPGVEERELADAALLSSLADETPEGRSIVTFAEEHYGLTPRDIPNAELVPFIDALILPEEAGELLIGSRDFPAALRKMAAMGPKMPAITCGPKGCYYYDAGRVYHCSAFKIRAVDTTGCGDSFHGAFAYALANGYDVHRSVRFASAVAALKATKQGGRSGLPTLAEVEQFIAARPDEAVVTEQ